MVPDKIELLQALTQIKKRYLHVIQKKCDAIKQQMGWVEKHLLQQHPKRQLTEKAQRLDFAMATLKQCQQRLLTRWQTQWNTVALQWKGLTPIHRVHEINQNLTVSRQKLHNVITYLLYQSKTSLTQLSATLDALSPLSTLNRGYAIATLKSNKHILRKASEAAIGEHVEIQLKNGLLECVVEKSKEMA